MARKSEARGESLSGTFPSLWQRFQKSVTSYPKSLAVVSTYQPHHLYGFKSQPLDHDSYRKNPYLRWSYSDLNRGVSRLSIALKAQGVHPGMPIIYFVPNSIESVLILWAAIDIGCVCVPLNPKNLDNREEVSHMVNVVKKAAPGEKLVFIAGAPELMVAIESLPGATESLKIVVSDHPQTHGWTSFTELMGEGKEINDVPLLDSKSTHEPTDDIILFTSGTTSLPKGVRWTTQCTAFIAMIHGFPGFHTPGSILCAVAPNNHSFGLVLQLDSLFFGGTVVFPGPTFAPGPMLTALCIEKCTHTVIVPTMIHALVAAKEARGDEPRYLKNVFVGGSLLTKEAVRQCLEDLGSENVTNCYGMTEGVLLCTGSMNKTGAVNKGGEMSVGWPGPGGRVKICSPGQRTPLPIAAQGELHYSGPNNVHGYIDQESSEFYDDDDGTQWFITGDQAVMDETGQIFIVGRYKGISHHRSHTFNRDTPV
jgi:acyl-CoA synthetase (AMP-forming)/AMP-acid ligase II